ncbi:EamA family transporter [Angustibacter sp. McL0619]|uniref:EamA family transporter n=1 Tax=Angustibacter sp. McL0619 TaxID=3415676 RepID=UPI003CEF7191
MATIAHDIAGTGPVAPADRLAAASGSRLAAGLAFAVVSATTFGMSGALATGLLGTGWSAGAVVLVRVGIAALVVAPFGALALRDRWHLLRRNAGLITMYGVLAVAGSQFCYFSAVARMPVGPALLIEYTAPATVVVWLWLRHGQRPGPVTLIGAALAAVGLVLVLDVLSGAHLNTAGVLWALGAMIGAASYFVISADTSNGLPPLALAASGLVVGAAVLGLLGLVGLLSMDTSTASTSYSGHVFAWWVPLVVLGLVTAAVSYTTGIAAGRRLGSRLASFVALLEVVAGVGFAWLLLNQLPRSVQLLGGLLILAGVVGVKLGERDAVAGSSAATTARATSR